MGASVKEIGNTPEYQAILTSSGDKLVVVGFTAKWCGPCQQVAPKFEEFATKYPNVTFVKVDVDKHAEISGAAGVTGMPTFHFYKKNKKIAEVKGANIASVEDLIKQHGEATPTACYGVLGQSNITDQINLNQLSCLNEKNDHGVRRIFGKDASGYLESDVDEQLMISIQFNQSVKLHSVKISAPIGQAPKTIKLYTNTLSMDFEEAEDVKETQALELTEKDYEKDATTALRFVKFQSVSSLILFVVDNLGDAESTRIDKLEFIGTVIDGSDRNQVVQKVEHSHE